MEIILRAIQKKVRKNIVLDHYWYDPDTKRRLHGRGGRMIFVYDHVNKKQIPRIINAEEWVYESNYPDILDWIKDNPVYVKSVTNKILNHYVAIGVDANAFSDIENELRSHGIMYDYDTNEYRHEVDDKMGKKKWQNSQLRWPTRLLH